MNAYLRSINNVLRSLIIYYIQILDANDEDITVAIAEGIPAAIVVDVSNDIDVDADADASDEGIPAAIVVDISAAIVDDVSNDLN